jgi:hypothetical protein
MESHWLLWKLLDAMDDTGCLGKSLFAMEVTGCYEKINGF